MALQVQRKGGAQLVNVGEGERLVSIGTGVALLAAAMVPGAPFRRTSKLKGSYLLLRGITGFCPAYDWIGINTVGVQEPRQVIDQLAAKYPLVRAVDDLAQQVLQDR